MSVASTSVFAEAPLSRLRLLQCRVVSEDTDAADDVEVCGEQDDDSKEDSTSDSAQLNDIDWNFVILPYSIPT